MSLFVAYGTEQLIVTSPDGLTWTQKYKVAATSDGSVVLGNIDWDGNQVFVAQGTYAVIVGHTTHSGTIVTSTDGGATWTNRTLTGSPQLGNGMPHGAVWARALGIWCAVGFDFGTGQAVTVTSPDAITWTVHNFAAEIGLTSIATNSTGSILVAITGVSATTSRIYSSVDGINWTLRKTLVNNYYNSLAYNGSYFMAGRGAVRVNGTAQNATSPDGINWTEGVSGQGATITSFGTAQNPLSRHVLYDPTLALWVVPSIYTQDSLSNGIFTSPDGLVWTKRYTAATDGSAQVTGIIRAGSKLYAMLNSATTHFLSSLDGITWTPVGTTLADPSFMLEWTGADFLTYSVPAAGDNFIRASPDGNHWTNQYDDAALDIVWIDSFQVSTPPPTADDTILMMRLVTGQRLVSPFSRIKPLPAGTNGGFVSLRQIYNPLSTNQENSFILVGVGADGSLWQLFGGGQDGSVTATAVTQPLPTLEDIPAELWKTQKNFREMYVEGTDVTNFQVSFSLDGGTTFPNGPYPLTEFFRIDLIGEQLVIKFTHSVASNVTPQLTSIVLNYDIDGVTFTTTQG